jgi:rhodanese-related sulfurtransferase/uncharacterized membrane protein YedE/YeeE
MEMNFPLNAFHDFGIDGTLLISLLIGIGFGFSLERGGFGSSKVLAGIFYGRDWRVLKVMFTAIVVAMLGLFLTDGAGLLVMDQVAYRSTYIWSQIVGGLILGIGFVTAGYCPGTSIVGAVSGKLDAIFTLVGVVLGIGVFEETYGFLKDFYYSGYMGEISLAVWAGVPQGLVVLGVVLMALGAFWAVERFGPKGAFRPDPEAPRTERPVLVKTAGVALVAGSLVMVVQFAGPGQSRAIYAGGPENVLFTPMVDALDVAGWVVEARPDLMVVDVRSDTSKSAVPGAMEVPAEDLLDYRRRPEFVPDRVMVIVDKDGGEIGREVVRSLRTSGLDVVLMRGGAAAWQTDVLAEPTDGAPLDLRAVALRMMVSGKSAFDGAAPPPPPKKGAAPPKRKKKKGGGC